MGLDPRDPGVFSDERLRSTLIQPGYDRLDGVDRNVIYGANGMMYKCKNMESYSKTKKCSI